MATLSKQDRIEISRKLIGIPDELNGYEALRLDTVKNKEIAQNKDSPNKKILDEKTALINSYQKEIEYFDGITRTELTEQILEDSVRRKLGNSFFPNNTSSPLPSVPDGVWKYFVPFSGNHAIGKDFTEQYTATGQRAEQDILDEIEAQIAIVEAQNISNRATGQDCYEGGSCSGETPPGSGTTEALCSANGGTWTPGGPDYYLPNSAITDALDEIKILVQEWEDMLGNEKAEIPTNDKDIPRQSGNDTAISDIDNALSVIDAWQSIQDYDTATALPSTCAEFDSKTESYWQQAKLQPTTLQTIKDEVDARQTYIPIRLSELNDDYLGSIAQDLDNGNLTAFTGLYGERMLYIDMRANVLSGTLSALIGLANYEEVQVQFKNATNIANSAYLLIITASKAIAPGLNTNFINVKDGSLFSAGDRVYLVADDQEELSGSIVSKDGNRLELSFKIPKKYTADNKTRVYKVL